jgi:predicted PurR-regulated permease PerM
MNQPTIEMFTCVAIIIAMGVVVFKGLSYPISNFIRYINPFNQKRIDYLSEKIDKLDYLSEKIDKLEMQQENLSQGLYYNEDYFKKLKSEIEKLKSEKKHSLKNQKKNEKRNEK